MGLFAFVQKAAEIARLGRGNQAITPPGLSDAVRFPYGPFRFRIQLAKRMPYTVIASTDFSRWEQIGGETAAAETFEYVDSDASKFSYRFYRVRAGGMISTAILGFATVTLPPGFSLIANPFYRGNNVVADAFKHWPDGTTLNKFDTLLLRLAENAVKNGKWTNLTQSLAPGEGAIFFNPTEDYKTHSFTGEVGQGSLTLPIPSGFSLRSSLAPQGGNLLDDLQFPIAEGDVIHLFDRDRQKYALYPFENGKWSAGGPIVSIGEAFWVAKAEPGNWNKSLIISEESKG